MYKHASILQVPRNSYRVPGQRFSAASRISPPPLAGRWNPTSFGWNCLCLDARHGPAWTLRVLSQPLCPARVPETRHRPPRRSPGAVRILPTRSEDVCQQLVLPVANESQNVTVHCPAVRPAPVSMEPSASMIQTRTTVGKAYIVRRSIAPRPGTRHFKFSSRPY